jgi:hypothetical protein
MCSRPFRPVGLPIYVARVPAAPFARRYPRDSTFYVADPISSIETRSLPTLTRSYPRRFTFYVADPVSSIRSERFLRCFAGTNDHELAHIIRKGLPGPSDVFLPLIPACFNPSGSDKLV